MFIYSSVIRYGERRSFDHLAPLEGVDMEARMIQRQHRQSESGRPVRGALEHWYHHRR
jgi:hypothetical protein